jgi:penicillin-binding protein 2
LNVQFNAVGTRMFAHRLRVLSWLCLAALAVVWARVAHLQLALGPWRRATLAERETRSRPLPAPRGTIRAGGTVLARDRCVSNLAVHYRYLERPVDDAWLTGQARSRLRRRDRANPARVAEAKALLLHEVEATWQALGELADASLPELDERACVVQRRVERIAESVNRRLNSADRVGRSADLSAAAPPSVTRRRPGVRELLSEPAAWRRLTNWLATPPAEPAGRRGPIAIVEQDRYYTIVEDLAPAAVVRFTSHPEGYPGVVLDQQVRRVYPERELACGVIGYVEPLGEHDAENDRGSAEHSGVGRSGVEGFYDRLLRGTPGEVREELRPGYPARAIGGKPPQAGQDIALTLHLPLQRFAEQLLDRANRSTRESTSPAPSVDSGVILVLDVHTGAVLAAATTPRFDLNIAAQPTSNAARQLAQQANSPLFNRIVQMSLPPGSVFKPITAIAALKSGVDPNKTIVCRGYLHDPNTYRCLIYRHHGAGHDSVGMSQALTQSCNVYFFDVCERIGWPTIVRWADEFGFGHTTGIDLASEDPGQLPGVRSAGEHGPMTTADGQLGGLAIGQGAVLASPMQVAVMMSAIANGGELVVPHVREDALQPPRIMRDISSHSDLSLAMVRDALARVISDPRGTGHEHVFLSEVEIAGKTGTAQSGSPRGDHAWFAGYAPATDPQFAFVVVLEHAGTGGLNAGPLARELVRQMHALGYFAAARRS